MKGVPNKQSFPALFDERRLRTLRGAELMDGTPEASFDRVTRMAARLLGVQTAFLSLIDDRKDLFKSAVGFAPGALPNHVGLELSFAKHVVESGARLVVSDARTDALVRNNRAIERFGIVAYVGIPVVAQHDTVLGALCVSDPSPRDWTDDELLLLEELAHVVSLEIDLRIASRTLSESESLYRTIAANIPNGAVTMLDRSFRFILAEGADVFETLGMTSQDLLGKSVFEIATAAEHGMFRSALDAVLRGEPKRFVSHRRGRSFEIHAVPMGGADGSVRGAMLLSYDVTTSKLTQDALVERTRVLERRTQHVELLQRITSEVNLAKSSDEAMQACLQEICQYTGWSVGHAYVMDRVTNELVPTDLWCTDDVDALRPFIEASENLVFREGRGLVGMVKFSGRAETMRNVQSDERFSRCEAAIASGLVSGFAFPVMIESTVAAVLEFYSSQDEVLDDEVRALMTNVGTQLGRAVERELHARIVETMSLTDELTGLHNRRGFLVIGPQQMQVVRRTEQRMLLVYADLDGLKRINDELGHEAGDRYLRRSAEILRNTFRRSDLVARLGGDEFVVLTSGVGPDAELVLRHRLEAAIDQANALHRDGIVVSMSLGVTSHDADSNESLEALLARADERMYRAKRERQQRRRETAPPSTGRRAVDWKKSLFPGST